MQQLHSDVWVAEAPLRFVGVEVGSRMTVLRLPDQKLLLHSPISATPDLVKEVSALGEVAYIVAPNRFHHLYVHEWQEACPEAAVYVAPGLEKKRKDLKIASVLTSQAEPGWAGVVEQIAVGGFALVNEVVFFHWPSATLIATDLAFNIGPNSPALTRLMIRLSGTYGRLAPTLLERIAVRDRPTFRRCLEQILEWPFERVIVSHGDVSEKGAREQLTEGYQWVLGSK
jgi:hypothetical protein